MQHHPLFTVALLFAAAAGSSPAAFAADAARGEELHKKQCVACHDSSVYTRPDRRVDSREALEAQVRRCDANLGTKWMDDDLADVIEYLNVSFYKFPPAAK
jgi:mono/diheme cytochrome c family protein